MRLSLAFLLAVFVVLGGFSPPASVSAQKEFGFDNRKGSGQPYLKPADSLAKMKVPDEFEVKLFAAEPDVVNPVAFTIDEKGRIWVVECFDYPKRAGKNAPRDRIVILEDTDGDGVCDKRTVFAEGKDFPVTEERKKAGLGAFDLCTGIEVGHGGVFVGAAPYLWFIENKNDKAGKFEVLLKGFGSQDTHETLNTFQWGPDGWLYGLHGIFTQSNVKPGAQLDGAEARINGGVWRYHPTQKKFEVFAEGTSNPWGMDWRNSDGQFILACCVIPHLYHIVPGGIYKRQAGASYNPHVYGYLNEISDHTFHKESGWAHAGLISLDTPHMPVKYRNSVIFGSIHGCSLKQNILKPNGSTYTASRGDDFLTSGDKNFRPINMKWGPAGDIYLIDWHDQNPCHQTNPDDWDYERGRIYRIQLKGTKTCKSFDLSKWTDRELVDVYHGWGGERGTPLNLGGKKVGDIVHHGGYPTPTAYWVRQAGRLLGERWDKLDKDTKALLTPHQSSWYQIVGTHNEGQLLAGIEATFVQEEWMRQSRAGTPPDYVAKPRASLVRALAECSSLTDKTWARLAEIGKAEVYSPVRRELAALVLRHADKHDVTPLVRSLMLHNDVKDPLIPQLVWLAYEKVLMGGGRKPAVPAPEKDKAVPAPGKDKEQPAHAGRSPVETELAWLAVQSPDNIFVRDQIVPKVMRRLVATGQASDLKLCVEFVAKLKDAASREKALDGLAIALDKQTVTAPEAWAALQAEIAKGNDPKLVALANKLAVSFRDPAAIKRALNAAVNVKLPVEARAEAVRQLATLKPTEAVSLLLGLLRTDAELAVRTEAVRSLAAFDSPTIPAALIARWKDYPAALRPDIINTLAGRKEGAKALLAAMADKTIDRTEVTDNTILRIQAFKDKELDASIERAWGRTRPTPADLAKLIDKTRDSLYEAPASFERGRKVFETNCAKCHKFDGKGAEVGPPLEGAARDIEYILVNVLDPNRVIGAPYFVRTARLLDDTVFQGVLAEEDEKTITLKIENGVLKKIKKADLNGPVQVSEKSLMPEGLGYNMTAQDFRDLVRYAMANPFVADVTVNGEKLSVGVPGRITLPDTKGAPAIVEAEVTAPAEVKTKLLVGSSADYEVRLDGKVIGAGKGTGKQLRPDQDAYDVTLSAGKHTLTVAVKNAGTGNVVYARFLDPDRKLKYADVGEKK